MYRVVASRPALMLAPRLLAPRALAVTARPLLARTVSTFVSNNTVRYRGLPSNTVIKFVPQQEAWLIERFGRYHRTLTPGLNVLMPFIDRVAYVQSLKEIVIEIPTQAAITNDNVTLHLDGVLYLRVEDPYKASYGVEDAEFAVAQLAQTTMRSEIGKMNLDNTFKERARLNQAIVQAMNEASHAWGIQCLRYEIRDVSLPDDMIKAMQMQASAERRKRAQILDSEGARQSDINIAEGRRQAVVLASEAKMLEAANLAKGEAAAIEARAAATAASLRRVGEALRELGPQGAQAISLNVAEKYVDAFSNVAKSSTTMLLPGNVGDASAMIAQALSIYNNLVGRPAGAPSPAEQPGSAAKPALPGTPAAAATPSAGPRNGTQ